MEGIFAFFYSMSVGLFFYYSALDDCHQGKLGKFWLSIIIAFICIFIPIILLLEYLYFIIGEVFETTFSPGIYCSALISFLYFIVFGKLIRMKITNDDRKNLKRISENHQGWVAKTQQVQC